MQTCGRSNTRRRRLVRGVAAFGILACATVAHAQDARRVAFDVTAGVGSGVGGGEVYGRFGFAGDALLSVSASRRARTLLIAASAGAQGIPFEDGACHRGTRAQCLPYFPFVGAYSALVGWEVRQPSAATTGATFRAMGGPALVYIDAGAGRSGNTAGAQIRADAASPSYGAIAAVASLRGTIVPRFRGQSLAVWAIEIGLRVR